MNTIDNRFLQQFGEVKENIGLSTLTTLKVGGKALYMVYPRDLFAFEQLIQQLDLKEIEYKVIGNGSNILASDDDYNGVLIKLTHGLSDVYFSDGYVVAQAGVSLIALAYDCAKRGLSCLEWAGGIPGTIGGAVYMNAGSYQSSMSDIVEAVYVYFQGQLQWIDAKDCAFAYRESCFKHQPMVICAVRLHTLPSDDQALLAKMKERQTRRLQSQPLDVASAGSCFRNPDHTFAWTLIDDCGLRGYSVNQAQVSMKHSNFIVNRGGASARDIAQVIDHVQAQVKEKTEVELCLEIEKFNWK